MERRLQTLILLIFCFFSSPFSAQISQGVYQDTLVRFSLWAQIDVYPGFFDSKSSEHEKEMNTIQKNDEWYSVPVRKIREIAPFLVEGMVYGWKFSYTPYDKARGVEEYFEFSPVIALSENEKNQIQYKRPWIKDDILNTFVEFKRTKSQEANFAAWSSFMHPRVKGVGYSRLSNGFDGIKAASEEALRNAVREFGRTKIKTKPKEISGTVIIREPPLIGIDSGRYRITLDFFIETDRIIEYRTF